MKQHPVKTSRSSKTLLQATAGSVQQISFASGSIRCNAKHSKSLWHPYAHPDVATQMHQNLCLNYLQLLAQLFTFLCGISQIFLRLEHLLRRIE